MILPAVCRSIIMCSATHVQADLSESLCNNCGSLNLISFSEISLHPYVAPNQDCFTNIMAFTDVYCLQFRLLGVNFGVPGHLAWKRNEGL